MKKFERFIQYSYNFVYLLDKPVNTALCINTLSQVLNCVTYDSLNGIFIQVIFLCDCNKMYTSVMSSMLRVDSQCRESFHM